MEKHFTLEEFNELFERYNRKVDEFANKVEKFGNKDAEMFSYWCGARDCMQQLIKKMTFDNPYNQEPFDAILELRKKNNR